LNKPGHEGVGIVERIGELVTDLKVGDRAGGGYHRHACGHCQYCLRGKDIWCYERGVYGEGDYNNGTFADYYLGEESFLHKIPDSLSSEAAAPLQCAGATVYSALIETIKPTERVGIIGIGGLGHLAIQFADKLGAEVVVFSTNAKKEAEARSFGAKEFYLLSDVEALDKPVEALIVAGNSYPDWTKFLTKNILARAGTIIPLVAPAAAPNGDLSLNATRMFFDGYKVHSSLVASRGVHNDMLNFAARHKIQPVTESFEFSEKGLEEAIKKMRDGSVRFRGVLVK